MARFVSEEKVPAVRAPSCEKVKLKNLQIFQFYKKIIEIPLILSERKRRQF